VDSAGVPVVAWHEREALVSTAYTARWEDGAWEMLGAFVAEDTRFQNLQPQVRIGEGDVPYVAWRGAHDDGKRDVFVAHWTGAEWTRLGEGVQIDPTSNVGSPAFILDGDSRPLVAFAQGGSLHVKRWSGSDWELIGTELEFGDNAAPTQLSIAVEGDRIAVAWAELHAPGRQPYVVIVKEWSGEEWVMRGEPVTSGTNVQTRQPSVAYQGGELLLAWYEYEIGPDAAPGSKVFVTRWKDDTWEALGEVVHEDLSVHTPDLGFTADGAPAIAFETWQEEPYWARKIEARVWDGNAWQPLGAIPYSDTNDDAFQFSLTSGPDGELWAAWVEHRGWDEASGEYGGFEDYTGHIARLAPRE